MKQTVQQPFITATPSLEEARPVSALHQQMCTGDASEVVLRSARLEKLLEMLPAGVVVLNSKGVIVEVNPAAEDILDARLKDMHWRDIVEQVFSPRADDGHEVSLKNGRRVRVDTCALGEEAGQLVLISDLSLTRQLQDELSRHQRLSEMGRVSAALAHQIRTPLASALLYISHIIAGELDDEKKSDFAEKVKKQLKTLEAQVNNMLLFVRDDQVNKKPFTLGQLIGQLYEMADDHLRKHRIQLQTPKVLPDGIIYGHLTVLVSALNNVIENSIQASIPEGVITLNVKEDEETVMLEIQDHGQGMSAAVLEKAVEPFVTTKTQGTGLGLAVAKAVVRHHGGQFNIKSEQGVGTSVVITLPWIAQSESALS